MGEMLTVPMPEARVMGPLSGVGPGVVRVMVPSAELAVRVKVSPCRLAMQAFPLWPGP